MAAGSKRIAAAAASVVEKFSGVGKAVKGAGSMGREKLSDQLCSVPVFLRVSSVISRVQVPAAVWPSKAVNERCGLNRPLKGAAPLEMGVAASSSRIVPVKLSPLPWWSANQA
jgi:hypothetical protein